MDAIEFLLQEHIRFTEAFSEFEQLLDEGDPDKIREAFASLRKDLATHEEAEETAFWPAVRAEVPNGEALVIGRLAEEQTLKEQLAQLDATGVDDSEFPTRARAFMAAVRAHAEQEEEQVFPAAREAFDEERLTSLGGALRAAKAIAPTRPHPSAPNTPPGNLVAGMVAGVVDRARDAAEGVVDLVKDTAEGVVDRAKDTAEGVAGRAKDTAEGVAGRAKDTAEGVAGRAKDTAEGVAGRAKEAAEAAAHRLRG